MKGKIEGLGEKPVPVPLGPSQIPRDLELDPGIRRHTLA
jgi:hypothetical protein